MTVKKVAYRSSQIVPDVVVAMGKLEGAAHERGGVKILYSGVKSSEASWDGVGIDAGPTGLSPHLSMRPAGREVYLDVQLDSFEGSPAMQREAELAVLWGLAVPLGFVPWQRYPVPGPLDKVFHFLGVWGRVVDHLHGEGRGEEAWSSVCAAAQCEVGAWEGSMVAERTLQAHLHRLGIHCGPVDGLIGERTLRSIRALGLGGVPLEEVVEALSKMKIPSDPSVARKSGHLVLGGVDSQAFSSGGVSTVKTNTGYSVTVDGPGRLIVMIGG